MKTIIAAIVTCVVIFGLSAGTTHYLMNDPDANQDPVADTGAETNTANRPDAQAGGSNERVPVAFRPESGVSIEAVMQMSDSIKRMEQELVERERKLKKEEIRIKMMRDDMQREQDEMKALSEGIDARIATLTQMAESMPAAGQQATAPANPRSGANNPTTNPSEEDATDVVLKFLGKMEPQQAAGIIESMANSGRLELAAQALSQMESRDMADILARLDKTLAQELMDAAIRRQGYN